MSGAKRERILIVVKTYPTLSKKYGETVCTAGVREDGSWVRMYPVPFRRLGEKQQYRKYDWVECRLVRNKTDMRPETFRPLDEAELQPVDHLDTHDIWRARRDIVLHKCKVWTRLDDLIRAAKDNTHSLAVFKPAKVLDFVCEPVSRDWDITRVQHMRELTKQHDLFDDNRWRETFRLVRKLPYKFSYVFEDAAGKRSTLMVLDWELGALFWNCLTTAGGRPSDEPAALEKVRAKYMDEFLRTDLHFYLGTTQQFHSWGDNPWLIIGALPIPHQPQLGLF